MSAAARLRIDRARPAPLAPDPAHHVAQLPPESAVAATRDWIAHIDAGRIGPPVLWPAPPPAAGELRLASLAAILGARRVPIW